MDSPLWVQLKENATIGVQIMREKTGTMQPEVNPEYQVAVEHFEIMRERLKKFFLNVKEILDIIPAVCESGSSFAEELNKANTKSDGKLDNLSKLFDSFYKALQSAVDSNLVYPTFFDPLNKIRTEFEQIENLKDQRRKVQLLYEDAREKLSIAENLNLVKKIEHRRQKMITKKEECEKMTEEFKEKVGKLWVKRYEILEEPLEMFISLIYGFCLESFKFLRELQTGATPEELMQQFLSSEI
ncbi:hypothetical protein TRFO_06181 [Tritrichomonas foetus]|uniref:BAR domain-containing protein n=1 Tax=Tritrichomonas foetus TaxID=1144522 RepID=A0A1J4K0I2_9EUKA|nr:hypothetical protein TRFO_06181 [Tritrichomonas foetus]|eukprot:OHT04747.1 hypothetical protein TRFO_06181 [Tritrichomonas foetus]